MINYIYEISNTLNNKVNFENLNIEIAASPIPGFLTAEGIKGKVYLEFTDILSNDDKTDLDTIVNNHDGLEARTTIDLQRKREIVLSKLVDMAHHHPILKQVDVVNNPPVTGSNVITEYLTSIDNWFNAWKRDGNHSVLINKIIADSQIGEPFEGFLNQQVTAEGVLTYQFLLSEIPTTPYI